MEKIERYRLMSKISNEEIFINESWWEQLRQEIIKVLSHISTLEEKMRELEERIIQLLGQNEYLENKRQQAESSISVAIKVMESELAFEKKISIANMKGAIEAESRIKYLEVELAIEKAIKAKE